MNNQEQQSYNPGGYPPSQHQTQYYGTGSFVEIDSQEQQQMIYDGPEYYTHAGEKLKPHSIRHRGVWFFWLLIPFLLILLISGLGSGISHFDKHPGISHFDKYDGFSHFDKHSIDGTTSNYTYTVSSPKLSINDTAANVSIHSSDGSADTVVVRITKKDNSAPNPIINQSGNTITINALEPSFSNNDVSIDITTPVVSDVQLKDGSGSVDISSITGNINAQVTDGSINADRISGQVALSSTSGDIAVSNSHLTGTSSLDSVNGFIEYNGSLDALGTYKFDTVDGSIDVALPNDAAFHLDAKSDGGSYNNGFGNNDVGNGIHPTLTLRSGNGAIDIHKG